MAAEGRARGDGAGAPQEEPSGEVRSRALFRHSAVSLWEEDISELRAAVRALQARGVTDFRAYTREHPEFARAAPRMIRVVDVSDATLALYEVSSKDDLVGPLDRTLDVEDPLVRAGFVDLVAAIADGREMYESESRAVTPGGRTLDILIKTSLPNEQDEYPYMLVNVTDITEQRRAENALRASEQLLRTLINNLPDYVYIKDRESRFILVNDAQARMVGAASPLAIVGKTDLDFAPRHLAEKYRADDVQVMRTGRSLVNAEEQSKEHSGLMRWVLTTKVPLFDDAGAVTGLAGISRDITERKEAEEKLRNFIEQSPEAITLSDEEGRIIEFNSSAERLTGIARSLAIGQFMWSVMDMVRPPERRQPGYLDLLKARVLNGLATGTADFFNRPLPTTLRRADGADRFCLEFMFPIRTAKGFQIGSVIRDVTEARETEEALRTSEEQLRQAQKMEAIGRLAGGIAHDFNNILTVIGGYCGIVREALPAESPLAADVEEIARAAARAAALTSQLLAFSRKQVLQPRLIDPNELIRSMEKMLGRVIGEDVALSTLLHPTTGAMRADPGQIEQVLMNLSVNARDAMPDGGRLTIETASRRLDEAFAREHPEVKTGEYVQITVRDTGIGMDGETLSRIYEPFFTTKDQGKGTGLGLSTVYGIVKQSDGHIFCASEPGKGTSFTLLFPRAAGAAEEERAPDGEGAAGAGAARILLVEDEEGVRNFTRTVLSRGGYSVIEASSGPEALSLEAVRRCDVDLVVSDVVMPLMSGRELARRVTASCPGVKVLYVSGYTEDAIVSHGVLEPGIHFIQKPFSSQELLGRVREILQNG